MLLLIGCLMIPFPLSIEALTTGSGLLLTQIIQFFGVTLSVFLARRFLDKRSFTSLGMQFNRTALMDLAAGFIITFLVMSFIFIVQIALGWVSIDSYAWDHDSVQIMLTSTGFALAAFILVGWSEELLSRGYHLQNITSGINLVWGVIISSAIFGALHLANFNASWAGALGIFFAGLFFAFSYLQTKQLWLPMSLHIGWNFYEGVLFGFPVSGLEPYSLIRISVDGPVIWTGGNFGPEGGLILAPALILGIILIYTYTYKREKSGKMD